MAFSDEKICCPKCAWEPDGHPYWCCDCNTCWNTFETYGKCPGCGKVWINTQCPTCLKWSPHAEWYNNLPGLKIEELDEERIVL